MSTFRSSLRATACATVLAVWSLLGAASAAPTPAQTARAAAAEEALKAAAKAIIAKNYEEATPLVIQAQQNIADLNAGNAEGKKLAAALEAKLSSARRVLESKGVKLPEPAKPGAAPAAGSVSFTKQVAPILVGRCNNCHVTGTRGGFSMANFNALMKGSASGVVVLPGKGEGSRLIEVLDSGDMPRGGGKLTDEQITLISKWIDQGARFDGPDPAASIAAGVTPVAATTALKVVAATGKESIKFVRDIAPVLAAQCTDCHGGQQPAARLSLETMTRILAGDRDGPVLVPGKPADSLIIKKLKGTAGDRMPKDRKPLSDETIAKFEKWISEGAKYDGGDANADVDFVAKVYRASQMSHKELAAERMELASANWKLGNPDDQPDKFETENFILLGNVGEDKLAEIGKAADGVQEKVAKILRVSTSKDPLIKGRVTVYAFRRRFDYSEHGKMVEKRDIPSNWYGHWKYNVIDSYMCVVPPADKEYSLEALMAEQLAGNYIDTLGKSPTWFSQGMAWAVGAAVDPRDPRSNQWDESVPGILAQCSKPDDFLGGKLAPADNAVLNYSFCKFLMSNGKAYTALLNALKDGKEFNQSFLSVYRADPAKVASAWAAKEMTRKR